jgi:small-conductance mechanosensitive channel
VNAGLKSSGRISQAVRALILVFAVVMAFEQLGIGQETMIRAFTIAFGGIVLALALAFGLGGRDQARDFLEKKLKKGQPEAGPPDDLKHL